MVAQRKRRPGPASAKFAQGPYPQIWGMDSARRSMLVGQLCHIFDLIRFFGGDVKCLHAMVHEATPTQFAYLVNLDRKVRSAMSRQTPEDPS